MTAEIVLEQTAFDHPYFNLLVKELDKELWVRYPETQQDFEPFNNLDSSCRVFVAYHLHQPVGCGCFRPKSEGVVEIKRMYVKPDFRNKGIARLLLTELERQAVLEGFHRAILETGVKQPEAIRAYQKSGYRQIPNFPPYENVSESICLEKFLPNV